MRMKKAGCVNVGIAGAGWWGQKIIATLQKSRHMQVVMVSDPMPSDTAKSLCAERGVQWAESYEAMLASPHVDVVILTTPNSLHETQIIQAAAAGKHVFCEKPLALTLESAQRAVKECLKHGVRLGIGHEKRFETPMKQLREVIEQGELGDILQIEGNFSQNKFLALSPDNWRLSKREAGCGPMTATGIHFLDIAASLAGPARSVHAIANNAATGFESGDSVSAQILFESGVVATVNAMLATPFTSRFAVYGTKGWFEIRDHSHVESPSGWVVTRSVSGGSEQTKMSEEVSPNTPVLENLEAFASAVLDEELRYPVSLEEMLGTTALLEAVARSAELREVVAVERPDAL